MYSSDSLYPGLLNLVLAGVSSSFGQFERCFGISEFYGVGGMDVVFYGLSKLDKEDNNDAE